MDSSTPPNVGPPDGEAFALEKAFVDLADLIASLPTVEERKHFRDLMGEGINRVFQALTQYRALHFMEELRNKNPN